MSSYQEAIASAQSLCCEAIDEACEIAMQDGGIVDALKLLNILMKGKTLPAPVLIRLEKHVAAISQKVA